MKGAAKRKGIDVEMRPLVRAMNRQGLGMYTIDSCFGHPGEDRLNHQSEAYVGFGPTDRTAMNRFWRTFWRLLGERAGLAAYSWSLTPDGEWGVQFSVSRLDPPGIDSDPGHWPGGFYRVHVLPMHDPAGTQGREQKLSGLTLLRDFCRAYEPPATR